MQHFVFVILLFLLSIAIFKIPFVKKTALSPKLLLALFLVRIAAGISLGWLTNYFSPINDYSTLNKEGVIEFNNLMHMPGHFFNDLFYSSYKDSFGGYFNAAGSYWNDLGNNIIIKLLAILNIISRGDYNNNMLLLNILPFLGSIAIYKIFIHNFPDSKRIVLFCCFLIPTTLFFSSGIHKDLFVYASLCFFCYGLYFSLIEKPTLKRIFIISISFLMILLLRNFVAVALIPATAGLLISKKLTFKPAFVFGTIYISIIAVVILLELCLPQFKPLAIITNRQEEFLKLPLANSQIELTRLSPDVKSFASNLPEAINHGFFRPYCWEFKHLFGLFASLEWLSLFLIPGIWLVFSKNKKQSNTTFILFFFAITLTIFIMIGYTIPNTNSIVRYKSIYLPFIFTPILCLVSLNTKTKNT